MCRYGNQVYKQHFACFDCRKSFKRPDGFAGWTRSAEPGSRWARRWVGTGPAPCPGCRRPMAAMGLDFQAPRRLDRERWAKVERLARHGFLYSSCGCHGPGPRPRALRDVPAFLDAHAPRSPGEDILRKLELRRASPSRR